MRHVYVRSDARGGVRPRRAGAATTHKGRVMGDDQLFEQLEAWRTKRYNPQLWGTNDGWVLVLDMTRSGMRDIGPNPGTGNAMIFRFNSNVCDTPKGAIIDALKVIQP